MFFHKIDTFQTESSNNLYTHNLVMYKLFDIIHLHSKANNSIGIKFVKLSKTVELIRILSLFR